MPTNSTSSETISDVVEREVRIAARPETIFSFFIDPARMMRWKGIDNALDPHPGGIFRTNLNGHDVVRGQYLEIVPYTRIVFTWGWEGDDSPLPPGSTTVEVSFIPDNGETIVRLRHIGLATPELRRSHAMGWDHYLPRLVAAAQGIDLGPDPWAVSGTMGES